MKSMEIEKKKEDFEWWITSLPDRIEELKESLPESISCKLDYSIESLNVIEDYVIDNYTAEYLESDKGKDTLNLLASYIGTTLKKLLPDTSWYIELEDEDDIYYCLPTLSSLNSASISPYMLPITISLRKKGDFLFKIVKNRLRPKV